MLRDDSFNLFPGFLADCLYIKQEDLVLAYFQEILHLVPSVILVSKQTQNCFQDMLDCLWRVHKGPDLLDAFRC